MSSVMGNNVAAMGRLLISDNKKTDGTVDGGEGPIPVRRSSKHSSMSDETT